MTNNAQAFVSTHPIWLPASLAVALGLSLTTLGAARPSAQGSPASKPARAAQVLGVGHFSPIVADLDRTVSFYRDVVGLEIATDPPATWDAEPWLRRLHGTPDSPIRFATARIPGATWGIEMVEFKDPHRRPAQPRMRDPGACTVALLVRDFDAVYARLKRAGTPVVSAGGKPIDFPELHSRAVIVRDPDGHFVEFVQPSPLPETKAPASANVIGGGMRIAVQSVDRALGLFRDRFGMPFDGGKVFDSKSFVDLMGPTGGKARIGTATLPDGRLFEFAEYQGVNRSPLMTRIEDPGSTRFQLIVNDLDVALAAFKSAGGKIISLGGEPIVENGQRYALVRDANGVFFVVWNGRS